MNVRRCAGSSRTAREAATRPPQGRQAGSRQGSAGTFIFVALLRSHGVRKKNVGKRKPTKGGKQPLILICIQLVPELLRLHPPRPWRPVAADRMMTVARADHEILPHSRQQHYLRLLGAWIAELMLPVVGEPLPAAAATVPKKPPRRQPRQLLLRCSQANRL